MAIPESSNPTTQNARPEQPSERKRCPLAALEAAGGHLVLTRSREPGEAPKVPLWRRWQERPAAAEVAEAHLFSPDAGVGIIPGSLDAIAADLDAGAREDLWARLGQPFVALGTRRGSHSFYDAPSVPVSRRRFEFASTGCRGEFISWQAFCLLHGRESIRGLAEALPRRGTAPLQLELFDLATVEDPAKRPRSTASPGTAPARIASPGPLEAATEGRRHDVAFWHLRHWAYRQSRGASFRIWSLRVRAEALAMRAAMPAPRLAVADVEWTARGVASWTWCRPPLDTSWLAQLRRGVKRQYGACSHGAVGRLWTRNAGIVRAVAGGTSRKAVGRQLGLAPRTVRRVLTASETWLSPEARAVARASIWGPLNPPPGGGG